MVSAAAEEQFWSSPERHAGDFNDEANPAQGALMLTALLRPPVYRVVEIGCGRGRLLRRTAFAHRGARVIGVDIAAPVIAAAYEYTRDVPNVALFTNDGRTLAPLRTGGGVDAFYSVQLFQHLPIEAVASYYAEAAAIATSDAQFVAQFVEDAEPGPWSYPHPLDDVILASSVHGWRPVEARWSSGWTWLRSVRP